MRHAGSSPVSNDPAFRESHGSAPQGRARARGPAAKAGGPSIDRAHRRALALS
jgi:hypothetical protein